VKSETPVEHSAQDREGTERPWHGAVLIPALDCERTIVATVRDAKEIVGTVVVVSDGSTDATAEKAAAAGAEVVCHATNLGKGAALETGMRLLVQRGFTHVLTMDGDGQHLGDQIPMLVKVAQENPHALVVGARQVVPGATTALKLFGNRFANRWVEIACGQRLPDTQSGFRVYPLPQTLDLRVRARRFAFETEVLIRAAREGLPIVSVPVQVYYPPPRERASHYRPFRDTVRIIFVVLGLIFRLW
jgi:glycosyltransferase involved in cell wall biosynthesis